MHFVDVRIGTDVGAGPLKIIISQDFYESAMNGIQWIIDTIQLYQCR